MCAIKTVCGIESACCVCYCSSLLCGLANQLAVCTISWRAAGPDITSGDGTDIIDATESVLLYKPLQHPNSLYITPLHMLRTPAQVPAQMPARHRH